MYMCLQVSVCIPPSHCTCTCKMVYAYLYDGVHVPARWCINTCMTVYTCKMVWCTCTYTSVHIPEWQCMHTCMTEYVYLVYTYAYLHNGVCIPEWRSMCTFKMGSDHAVPVWWSGGLSDILPKMAQRTNGLRCTLFRWVCWTIKKEKEKERGVSSRSAGVVVRCTGRYPSWNGSWDKWSKVHIFQRGMPDIKKKIRWVITHCQGGGRVDC